MKNSQSSSKWLEIGNRIPQEIKEKLLTLRTQLTRKGEKK